MKTLAVKQPPRTNPFAVVTVHDGDTFTVLVDVGYGVSVKTKFRLAGLNCPELKKPDGAPNPPGEAARAFTVDWLAAKHILNSRTVGLDKFGGRWNAYVYGADGETLNDALLDAGHAVAMRGGSSPPPATTRQFANQETP